MTTYLLSPHDDDSALFAAFTCLRERPTVVVVADSYVQPARGEVGCSADERAAETARAHAILGCPVVRLGLRDDALTVEQVRSVLPREADLVYTPALEGGHPQHDLVTLAALDTYGPERVRVYSTYSKLNQYCGPDLVPVGTTELEWTRPEYTAKQAALACYDSQRRVNPIHFAAVEGRSEWLSGITRVQLGCGERLWPGWINVDRYVRGERVTGVDFRRCDLVTDAIPVRAESVDYVYSADLLEHLPPDRRVAIINECWRVLVPGGVMEHYVPNAGSRNDFGSPSHLSHWNLQIFEHFDVESYRWRSDHAFEGIAGGFTKVRAELLNWQREDDGVNRAQSLHVMYRKVAAC